MGKTFNIQLANGTDEFWDLRMSKQNESIFVDKEIFRFFFFLIRLHVGPTEAKKKQQ